MITTNSIVNRRIQMTRMFLLHSEQKLKTEVKLKL